VRFRGRLEVALDDVGRSQAIAAGHALADAGLTAVYSSPLNRALEVGTAIATAAGLTEVVPWDDLINVDYGNWEGRTDEESAELDPDAWELYLTDPENAACPGGEALADAADRVVRALTELGARHAGESIAFVSHGVMVRLAALRLADVDPLQWQFRIPTGGSLRFEVQGGTARLASPLPEGKREDDLAVAEPARA
jgi:broad specificity phosphatase PhoE